MQVQPVLIHRPPSCVLSHETPTNYFWSTAKRVNPGTSDVNKPDEKVWKSEMGKYLQAMLVATNENIKTSYGVYLKCYLECLIQRHLTRPREFEEAEEKKLLTTTELLSSLLELQQIEMDLKAAMHTSAHLVFPLLEKYQEEISKLGSPLPPYRET